MAEKHLKKCSTSLAIRGRLIKTTLRFYLIPVRMAKIKNSGESSAGEDVEKNEHFSTAGGIASCENCSGSQFCCSQKIGHNTTRRPNSTSPGHIPRRCFNMQLGYMFHYVHSSLLYNSQLMILEPQPLVFYSENCLLYQCFKGMSLLLGDLMYPILFGDPSFTWT